ncbi:MAG: endonuclease III [Erysipelotrichaceae bacterium]
MTSDEILDHLEVLFPDAHCALNHQNAFELIVAVVLSAQTTDEAVNKITPALFTRFPTPLALSSGSVGEIEPYLKRIGLYHNKARMIHSLAKSLVDNFDGEVPSDMDELTSLAGVGRKTANVVRSVSFDIPAFAVDTHVERISKRLGLAKVQDSVETVEKKCCAKIKRERWNQAHHLFIFFGRYQCMARNPICSDCLFQSFCKKDKLEAYRKQKKKQVES